jgi:hypothetical protein
MTGRPPLVVKEGGGVVTAGGGGEDEGISGGGEGELLEDEVFPVELLEDENPAGSRAGGLEEVTLAGTVKPDPGMLEEGTGSAASVGEDSDEEDFSTGFAATSFCHIDRTAIVPRTPTPTSTSKAIPPPIASHAPVDKPSEERAWLGS